MSRSICHIAKNGEQEDSLVYGGENSDLLRLKPAMLEMPS